MCSELWFYALAGGKGKVEYKVECGTDGRYHARFDCHCSSVRIRCNHKFRDDSKCDMIVRTSNYAVDDSVASLKSRFVHPPARRVNITIALNFRRDAQVNDKARRDHHIRRTRRAEPHTSDVLERPDVQEPRHC